MPKAEWYDVGVRKITRKTETIHTWQVDGDCHGAGAHAPGTGQGIPPETLHFLLHVVHPTETCHPCKIDQHTKSKGAQKAGARHAPATQRTHHAASPLLLSTKAMAWCGGGGWCRERATKETHTPDRLTETATAQAPTRLAWAGALRHPTLNPCMQLHAFVCCPPCPEMCLWGLCMLARSSGEGRLWGSCLWMCLWGCLLIWLKHFFVYWVFSELKTGSLPRSYSVEPGWK